MSSNSYTVTENLEDPKHGNYEVIVDGEAKAYMRFSRLDKVLILHHTEVKPALRGKGVAMMILEYAVKDARNRGLKINALCPFSRKTLESDSSYHDVFDSD